MSNDNLTIYTVYQYRVDVQGYNVTSLPISAIWKMEIKKQSQDIHAIRSVLNIEGEWCGICALTANELTIHFCLQY